MTYVIITCNPIAYCTSNTHPIANSKGVAGILGGSLSMLEARIGHLFPKKIQ